MLLIAADGIFAAGRLCKVSYYDAHKYRILIGFTVHSILLVSATAQITIPSGRCFRSNPADIGEREKGALYLGWQLYRIY